MIDLLVRSLEDDTSRGHQLLTASWVEFAVATFLILLRTYTQFRHVDGNQGTWALVFALAAWAIGVLNAVCAQLSVYHGMGQHIKLLSHYDRVEALKWRTLVDSTSRLASAVARVSVVAFLIAVEGRAQSAKRRGLLLFIAISGVITNIVTVFFIFFKCNPPAKEWNSTLPGNCNVAEANERNGYFNQAWNAFCDIVLACYPVFMVWKLQMEIRIKLGLSILMGLGLFAAGSAVATAYELHVVQNTTDPTYVLAPLGLWSLTEMWVIIIASAIPALWPLLKYYFESIKKTTSSWQGKYLGSSKSYGTREKYVPFGESVKAKKTGSEPDVGISERELDVEAIALRDLGAAPAENHIYRSRSITIETGERLREDSTSGHGHKHPWEWHG